MNRIALLLLLALSGCAGLGGGRADNILRRGRDLQRANRLERAIDAYRQAIAAQPDSAEAHFSLAAALLTQSPQALGGEPQSALEKAVALDKTHAAARYTLAAVIASEERKEQAMDLYKEAVALEPKLRDKDMYLKDILKARGMGRKGPTLGGERLLRMWVPAKPIAPSPGLAPRPLPPGEGAALPLPAGEVDPSPGSGEGRARGNPLLERLRLDDADPANSDAYYTLGMQMKASGERSQAEFLLRQFITLEKSSASPRRSLIQKAEKALFELDVAEPEADEEAD